MADEAMDADNAAAAAEIKPKIVEKAMKTYLDNDGVRIGRATSVAAAAAIQEYVRLLTAAAAKHARKNGERAVRASHVHEAAREFDL